MEILYSPQRSDNFLEYNYESEKLVATYHKRNFRTITKETEQGLVQVDELQTIETFTDIFDFTGLPDGIANGIETSLPVNPIISAERENGTLSVVVLNFIGEDATQEEKFPEWQEV